MKFTPYPKSKSINKGTKENTYECSDGTRITQKELDMRIRSAKIRKGKKLKCTALGDDYDFDTHGPLDWSHTISVERCKELGKSELSYDLNNMVCECRASHMDWESYKSGDFQMAMNVIGRMRYLKERDPEGFEKRIQVMDQRLINLLV